VLLPTSAGQGICSGFSFFTVFNQGVGHDACMNVHNEYCISIKNILCEVNSLCTKSRGLRGDTLIQFTQFAIYNAASPDYKNAAVVEANDLKLLYQQF